MCNTIFTETPTALPPIDRGEVLRYAHAVSLSDAENALLDECIAEVQAVLTPRVCYRVLPVKQQNDTVDFELTAIRSAQLLTALGNCKKAVIFAATLGIGLDRLIAKYDRLSPAKALWIGSIGNERIEAVCDRFQAERAAEHGKASVRYSPGYGDLPLTFQQEIFRILDCPRKIGLTLNDSLFMTPCKSVTAIFGVDQKD